MFLKLKLKYCLCGWLLWKIGSKYRPIPVWYTDDRFHTQDWIHDILILLFVHATSPQSVQNIWKKKTKLAGLTATLIAIFERVCYLKPTSIQKWIFLTQTKNYQHTTLKPLPIIFPEHLELWNFYMILVIYYAKVYNSKIKIETIQCVFMVKT